MSTLVEQKLRTIPRTLSALSDAQREFVVRHRLQFAPSSWHSVAAVQDVARREPLSLTEATLLAREIVLEEAMAGVAASGRSAEAIALGESHVGAARRLGEKGKPARAWRDIDSMDPDEIERLPVDPADESDPDHPSNRSLTTEERRELARAKRREAFDLALRERAQGARLAQSHGGKPERYGDGSAEDPAVRAFATAQGIDLDEAVKLWALETGPASVDPEFSRAAAAAGKRQAEHAEATKQAERELRDLRQKLGDGHALTIAAAAKHDEMRARKS